MTNEGLARRALFMEPRCEANALTVIAGNVTARGSLRCERPANHSGEHMVYRGDTLRWADDD